MPARKSFEVPNLQELCLTFISTNIDFWCNDQHTTDINAVAKLPNILLNEICKRTMRRDNLHPRHLNTLIHQNTTDLDLTVKSTRVIERGIGLIHYVCTNLTSLNLGGRRIRENTLADIMKSIPKIKSLGLRGTNTTDYVLRVLGENCLDLGDLDLFYTKISNVGVKELCEERPAKDDGKPGGQCRLIHTLGLFDTRVSDEGVATALRNLPYLRRLEHDNSLTPCEILYRENDKRQYELKLEKIYYITNDFRNNHATIFSVEAAVALCKNVKKLRLSRLSDRDSVWLPTLANFSQLEELSISTSSHIHNLYNCITPILRGLGGTPTSM